MRPLEIDISMLRAALFDNLRVRKRICRDFGIPANITAKAVEAALFEQFGQQEVNPELESPDNSTVFEAAVRAIGSNSRRWSTFCAAEPRIREVLCEFDPELASQIGANGATELRGLLSGLTSGRDTKAILCWANRLAGRDSYYARLLDIRVAVLDRAKSMDLSLSDAEITAGVAAVIGTAPRTFGCARTLKAPGMMPTLASEFLRNLGWPGFKPDRHIMRLLKAWFGEDAALRGRASRFSTALGTRRVDVQSFLYFSMLGAARSPRDMPIARVDNLVWLYGSVVATRPRKRSQPCCV